jgi:hypothetical protein
MTVEEAIVAIVARLREQAMESPSRRGKDVNLGIWVAAGLVEAWGRENTEKEKL